jgi:hypothetical protein
MNGVRDIPYTVFHANTFGPVPFNLCSRIWAGDTSRLHAWYADIHERYYGSFDFKCQYGDALRLMACHVQQFRIFCPVDSVRDQPGQFIMDGRNQYRLQQHRSASLCD